MPTLELAFRPGATTEVFVPDENLLFCTAHQKVGSIPDQHRVIQQALDNPIGSLTLEELLRDQQRANGDPQVTVLIDDITRPTPTDRILPHVLDRITGAGIPECAVRIFVAMGTHRVMTKRELVEKVGSGVLERYQVINRDYLSAEFVSLGKTSSGTPIEVDRVVVEADVKVAIGNVVPHISAGWGGGSKIILPGACSQSTTDMMHLMACIIQPVLEVLGRRDNKPRAEMDAIAERLGLDFVLNTVMDEDKNILGAFAGHFIAAHRHAVELAEQVMVFPIPRPADIVIVSATPCYVDYWQGIKPYVYAHRAVREGGIIVFLLDGVEGLCGDAPSHEETVRKYLSWSFDDQKAAVERGEVKDLVGLNVPMYHATVRDRVRTTICVTRHLPQADIEALGFDTAPDVQSALTEAFGMLGDDAKVGVIPFGGETLVRVGP